MLKRLDNKMVMINGDEFKKNKILNQLDKIKDLIGETSNELLIPKYEEVNIELRQLLESMQLTLDSITHLINIRGIQSVDKKLVPSNSRAFYYKMKYSIPYDENGTTGKEGIGVLKASLDSDKYSSVDGFIYQLAHRNEIPMLVASNIWHYEKITKEEYDELNKTCIDLSKLYLYM